MQGEALFDIRKRPSRLEKGVSLILEYYYIYFRLALLCKLIAVITPLSIRRGVGGEAVDGLGVRLFVCTLIMHFEFQRIVCMMIKGTRFA